LLNFAELDGTNSLKFYFIDLVASVHRVIQDPKYADQLYHAFEMQTDSAGQRMFQKANSGLIFESFQILDPTVSPMLVVVASDPSHKGNVIRHPMYCKFLLYGFYTKYHIKRKHTIIYNNMLQYVIMRNNESSTGCMLNYHEGVRNQATSWIPFAWLPAYDEKLAPLRPSNGYESHTYRRIRMEHQALSIVFKDWDLRTKDAVQLYWGGKILRDSKLYLAAVVVDHPQLDKFAGSSR